MIDSLCSWSSKKQLKELPWKKNRKSSLWPLTTFTTRVSFHSNPLAKTLHIAELEVEAKQPIHSILEGKGLGIQQETSVWVGPPKLNWKAAITRLGWNNSYIDSLETMVYTSNKERMYGLFRLNRVDMWPSQGQGETTTRTMVPWRQGFRHPTSVWVGSPKLNWKAAITRLGWNNSYINSLETMV